jgi:glutathione synthase/RimK-type ligase-like ATP-grasp enzyme
VELTYEYRNGTFQAVYDGKPLTNVGSVWFRKPIAIWGDKLPVPPQYRQYSESAILAHVRELYAHFSDAVWVSDYFAIRRADYKGLQLEVASSLGFRIPDTVSTSDSAAAKAFIERHDAAIVKSLAVSFPNTAKGEPTMFYSRKIQSGQDFDLSGLRLAPAIFQEAIDHDLDIRVTVVGRKAFAVAIHASGVDESLSLRDWRPAHFYGKLDFQPHSLPKPLEKMCIELVQQLGLKYGAIDLLRDKQGKYWFLENNPNGEWAFVEHYTGQPIGKALAALLLARK